MLAYRSYFHLSINVETHGMFRLFVQVLVSSVVVLCTSGSLVRAELREFAISGVILPETNDPDGDFPTIQPGTPFSGFFRYDDQTPDITGGADPQFGSYLPTPPFMTLSFTAGGVRFASFPDRPAEITVVDNFDDFDFGPSDQFTIYGDRLVRIEGFEGTTVDIGMSLVTSDLSVLSGSGLPSSIDVSQWENRFVFFTGVSPGGNLVEIYGEILVPEPHCGVWLGGLLLCAGLCRLRRRTDST
jgi:hypothetical protein